MFILTTIRAAATSAVTRARKAITRRYAAQIVDRRNGDQITAAVENGDLVTIEAHLTNLGADTDLIRRYGPTLGKHVKAAHTERTGRAPMRVWKVGPHGYPIEVYVYSPADPSLVAGVAGYQRTAHLAPAGGNTPDHILTYPR